MVRVGVGAAGAIAIGDVGVARHGLSIRPILRWGGMGWNRSGESLGIVLSGTSVRVVVLQALMHNGGRVEGYIESIYPALMFRDGRDDKYDEKGGRRRKRRRQAHDEHERRCLVLEVLGGSTKVLGSRLGQHLNDAAEEAPRCPGSTARQEPSHARQEGFFLCFWAHLSGRLVARAQ